MNLDCWVDDAYGTGDDVCTVCEGEFRELSFLNRNKCYTTDTSYFCSDVLGVNDISFPTLITTLILLNILSPHTNLWYKCGDVYVQIMYNMCVRSDVCSEFV